MMFVGYGASDTGTRNWREMGNNYFVQIQCNDSNMNTSTQRHKHTNTHTLTHTHTGTVVSIIDSYSEFLS